MDEARSKHGSAHYHQWNWQCWGRLPGVIAEDGIVEFVKELCLRFGLFDDNTQVSLHVPVRKKKRHVKQFFE